MNTIKLSNRVRVSDPCYDNDVWCKTKLENVLPGEYEVTVEHSDEGGWGNRVSQLQVVHKDYTNKRLIWNEHSEIGVDSGQAGIFCESSYRNDEVAKEIVTPGGDWLGFPSSMTMDNEGDVFYDKMCAFTINGDGRWGSYDSGVVTSSGFGDGGYPLDVVKEDDKIVAMRITYIFPEDEEEESDDDDQDE